MNALKRDKQLAVISALVEGNSIRSVERMTGVHRDTILRLLIRVGEHCQKLLDRHLRDFHSRLIQADEIWCFVRKKEDRLTLTERANPEWKWVWDVEPGTVERPVAGHRVGTPRRTPRLA